MRSSIILTVPFAAMALGQVVRFISSIHLSFFLSSHRQKPLHLPLEDEERKKQNHISSPKKTCRANCCPFFFPSPIPSASSLASRQSSPLSLCQWPLRQHRSLYPSLPNQQLSPSLLLFQPALIQPLFKSRFPPCPLSPWSFHPQSQTLPSPLELSRQPQPVQVPSQRLEQQPREQPLGLPRPLPAQPQHPLPAPLLVWCSPFSDSAWLAQSSPPSFKTSISLGFDLGKSATTRLFFYCIDVWWTSLGLLCFYCFQDRYNLLSITQKVVSDIQQWGLGWRLNQL